MLVDKVHFLTTIHTTDAALRRQHPPENSQNWVADRLFLRDG